MKVKEIAKLFGMNVNTLASATGYSRQGLYNAIENKCNRNDKRFNAFIDHLQFISMHIHEQDIAEAKIQYNLRKKLLEELKEGVKNE